jgi:hypothetical protein
VTGGVVLAISSLIRGWRVEVVWFAFIGVLQGLCIGAILGILLGIFTRLFFFPPRNQEQYKLFVTILFPLFSASGYFLLSKSFSFVGIAYSMELSFWLVIVPPLLMGLIAIPFSQRLASWYTHQYSHPDVPGRQDT